MADELAQQIADSNARTSRWPTVAQVAAVIAQIDEGIAMARAAGVVCGLAADIRFYSVTKKQ